ncbi:MAG TPA: polysaccharide biosynthesis/export family protein [Puia sp.]|nr:polysaccharide biosynthesis/export family protein [Puia sp.]
MFSKQLSVLSTLLLFFTTSCVNTRKAVYFNNIPDTILTNTASIKEPLIEKNDLLSITVSSLNAEASTIFNTPNLTTAVSSVTAGSTGVPGVGSPQFTGYLVNQDGSIKFPVLGTLPVAGLTKKQLEETIADSLAARQLLVDPIINVRFLNFRVTVLGEVAKPTTINVSNERISILEALGLAGDLTIYAKRDNVLLIREEGNKKIIKRIDLNSEKILSSPYYYLKTNDIVYVEPGKTKIYSTSRALQLAPAILAALGFIAIIVTYHSK